MGEFSLIELRVLAGLAEGRTLSDIAERTHFGQPAISKVLRMAERRVAIPIVTRQGRHIQLTAAGMELAEAARLIVAQLNGLDRLIQDLHSGRKGSLRILSNITPSNYLIPGALEEFLKRYPDVAVTVEHSARRGWKTLLREGFDLAIGVAEVVPSGWVAESLYVDELTFFVAPHSPYAGVTAVRVDDLRSQRFITGPSTAPFWKRILDVLAEHGLCVDPGLRLQGPEAIKQLVASGQGIGVHLRSVVWAELRAGSLVQLRVEGVSYRRQCFLVRPDVSRALAVVEEFCRCLRVQVQNMHQH